MTKFIFLGGFAAATAAFLTQKPFAPGLGFPQNLDNDITDACTISKSTAFEVLDGSNEFSTTPHQHMDSVKITPAINKTNWEQWEFDGMSDTGLSSILMGFSRDYSYHFFGQGNLRVEFYITLGDGTIIQELDYLEESTIINCPEFIHGVFNSTKKLYSFHVTKDEKHALLTFNSTRVRGTVKMSSTIPPHFADGSSYESKDVTPESTVLGPSLHYALPMPAAYVEVNATLLSGKRITFTGQGGHSRLWAKDGWLNICDGWHGIRAKAGPYSIEYWEITSRLEPRGTKYYAGHLFHHDQLMASSQIGEPSETQDYLLFSDVYDGEVRGKLADKNTGHILEFVSPSRDKRWRFEMQHILKQYEMGVGGGFGLSGFANRVTGGELGSGLLYEGRGNSEQTIWPEYIAQWKIWVVYGIGFLGSGKHYIMQLAGYLF